MKPLVSVLIPAYNAASSIEETLRSALGQTWPRKEIIVVDDGSTDCTLAIARRFTSRDVLVVSHENQGAAATRNKASSLCQGDYVQWLDADDLLSPDKIARQMAMCEQRCTTRTLLSSGWAYFISRPHRARFTPTALWCDLSPVEWLTRKMSQNLHMKTATWLVSRELTEAAGPWNTSLLGDDDGEYFCRVLLASDGVVFVPEARVFYRMSGFSRLSYIGRSRRKIDAHFASMRLHIRYLLSLEDTERTRAACVNYLQTWFITFYPERLDIVSEAEELAARLGGRLEPPRLSWKYDWIRRLFGWGPAKRAQEHLRRAKWSTLRRWDRLLARVPGQNPGLPRPSATSPIEGRRAAVLLFSYYPSDPRPRRAAEALVAAGMRVEVICLRQWKDEPARETCNGVDVLRLPLRRRRGGPAAYLLQYSTFIFSTFLLLTLRSLRRPFALVHVHNMPDVLVFSALVPKALGARVVLDLHDPMPELMTTIFRRRPSRFAARLLEQLERASIRVADVVFTVNVACKRLFGSRSCHPDKIHVIMNSPDEGIFSFRSRESARSDPGRAFVIMYHGAIVERNGLDVAITALETVRRSAPRAELRIYGEPTPLLESLMETVRPRGLADAVRFLGAKSLPDIVSAIDDCDVGIIPNRRTVFTELNTPTRIFEYLSRGKPVITGRAPGTQDYFSEDALFFFELGDSRDLAQRILHVFYRPDDVDRVVQRGQEVYLAHRWSGERSRLVDEITRLLSPAPARPSSAGAFVVGGHSR